MAAMADPSRPAYPPPHDYQGYGQQQSQGYGQQHTPPNGQRDGTRSSYPPPPDASRQSSGPAQHGQYPPPQGQGQYPPGPQPYPPPQQWAGPPQGQQPQYAHAPPPPPNHHYDPQQHPQQHPQYHYPPPTNQPGQPPMHPDPYRLPQPVYHYSPTYVVQPAPAPRQRTAIACKYCRKRKIRCSGYDSSPDGRCQNCIRFSQQCLFHPVSSQAAFVPASALYGPNARAPLAGQDGQQGQNGQPQPMLYGAHGQPLGPAGPGGQPQYNYPPAPPQNGHAPPPQPQGYPQAPYPNYPPTWPNYGNGAPPDVAQHGAPVHVPPPPLHHFEPAQQQHQPPPTASSDRSDRSSLKRGPPEDESQHENGASHSPRPSTKPRHSAYEGRPSGSFEYQSPTSPAGSTMSYQPYQNGYGNGAPANKGNNSPPAGLTPNSLHSYNSPHSTTLDNRTPPPAQPGSAGSSQNGRSGMKVHEMLGGPNHVQYGREQRDNEMLSKLDGKR